MIPIDDWKPVNADAELLERCKQAIKRVVPAHLLLVIVLFSSTAFAEPVLRGVYFNPKVSGEWWEWIVRYDVHKNEVNKELSELIDKTGINFIDIQILIPWTLKTDKVPPSDPNAPISTWANIQMLNNLVGFLDYCYSQKVTVEVDLCNNMWIPYTVDTNNHNIINKPCPSCYQKGWPVPDEDPWTESIIWYTQIIEYVEKNVKDKRAIAFWDMMGSYQFGSAEPLLWDIPDNPKIKLYTERFVKKVWPHFYKAGERPKGSPIMLPLYSKIWYGGKVATPRDRLSGFYNLRKWLVHDLNIPPDYWVMTTYINCDPAMDGHYYLKNIVEILRAENAHKIISTDFKCEYDPEAGVPGIIDRGNLTAPQMFQWHFNKAKEYGFAGWWWYAYRDGADPYGVPAYWGIRDNNDNWREDLIKIISQQKVSN
jgi:hypothetical protein